MDTGKECHHAFEALKKAISKESTLALPDSTSHLSYTLILSASLLVES